MPGLDITIGSDQYKTIDVPEGCTVGKWKGFVAEGCLGKKVLYAEKLVCRSKLGGPVLQDGAPLPAPPERLYIEGRPPIIKVLQLALKDKLKQEFKPAHLMHPKPASERDLWKRNTLAAGKEGVETAAAKVFAQELDEATIRRIWKRFPTYRGEVPESAIFWSEGDLERFFASGGQLKPCEVAEPGGQTCTLLRKLRLELAERGVGKVTSEYKALGRHMDAAGFQGFQDQPELPPGVQTLPGSSGCSEVQRAAKASKALREPLVLQWLPGAGGEEVVSWDLDFWKSRHGDWAWNCRARAPAFEGDISEGPDAVVINAGVAEYIDYARVLVEEDPAFEDEASMAYFRVGLHNFPAFTQCMWPVFEKHWKELSPPGVEDLTTRWVRLFADKFNTDWLQFLSRFFLVSMSAPGTITRLHRENFGAHLWVSQTEGRKLFFLFSPKEAEKLYASTGGRVACNEGYVSSASPVDIFSPNLKRHPRFSEASAKTAVLQAGETLLIPSGWWWYSVALEPCASIAQTFFNTANHRFFSQACEDLMLQYGELQPDSQPAAQDVLQELQEEISEDTEDWALVVTDGGS